MAGTPPHATSPPGSTPGALLTPTNGRATQGERVETVAQIVARIAKAIWPHDSGAVPFKPEEVFEKLSQMAVAANLGQRPETEVIAVERCARFVQLAAQRGETPAGQFIARQAWEIFNGFFNPPMTWEEALHELSRGHAVRRTSWADMRLDATYGNPGEYPHTVAGADVSFKLALVIGEYEQEMPYAPTQEDLTGGDWVRA